MNQTKLLLFLATILLAWKAYPEIYKWTDDQGRIHYSDKKPENSIAKEIKIKPHIQTTEKGNEELPDSTNPVESSSTSKNTYKKKPKVIMYGASWCGYCKTARAYFKKNKIRYTEYDIEKNLNANKRYLKLGGNGVPLLVAKRKTMQGFSPSNFENWYNSL